MTRIKVVHIITGLNLGGAEMMLYKLATHMDPDRFDVSVISLGNIGPMGERLVAADIPVYALGMDPRIWNVARHLVGLIRLLRSLNADVVQTWMYHADLIGGLAARLSGTRSVSWGIRQSTLSANKSKLSTKAVRQACRLLSHLLPRSIVCCSHEALAVHADLGYSKRHMCVIPNGFETSVYKRDPAARAQVRRSLSIDDSWMVVGMVARFDPQKDYATLIKCALDVIEKRKNTCFVLCGKDVDETNSSLMEWIGPNLANFRLLGPRTDTPQIYNALDICVLSSAFGEGFPNVLGEAMSCETPCVASDVGDSARILGDTGTIVPPGDPRALSTALLELLSKSETQLRRQGELARKRILDRYSIDSIAREYESHFAMLEH